jgi:Cytochrome b5-like Heme/Steroid binding domain
MHEGVLGPDVQTRSDIASGLYSRCRGLDQLQRSLIELLGAGLEFLGDVDLVLGPHVQDWCAYIHAQLNGRGRCFQRWVIAHRLRGLGAVPRRAEARPTLDLGAPARQTLGEGFASARKSWHGAAAMALSSAANQNRVCSAEPPSPLLDSPEAILECLAGTPVGSELGYWLRFFGVVGAPSPQLELAQALGSERAARGADPELSRRARWLQQGTDDVTLLTLHPRRDADQLHQRVMSLFRVESRVLETLAVNRIAQSTSLLLLVRATGKAEGAPVLRYYDTYALLANVLEWGVHSDRGGRALARMRDIHSHYEIPAEGMKYILLETAFTWLQGAAVIAHRPLHELERLGFFHAYIELGVGMGVPGLSHDYAAMEQWVNAFNQEHRAFHPSKRGLFERTIDASLATVPYPNLIRWFRSCLRAAMDDAYAEATGQAPLASPERQCALTLVRNLGTALERSGPGPWLRSVSKNPARAAPTSPENLGSSERSPNLPPKCDVAALPLFTREQVGAHCHPTSLWLIIEDDVFDLTEFVRLHPGGREPLIAYAGRDATDAFRRAGHSELVRVLRNNYRIGRLGPDVHPAWQERIGSSD